MLPPQIARYSKFRGKLTHVYGGCNRVVKQRPRLRAFYMVCQAIATFVPYGLYHFQPGPVKAYFSLSGVEAIFVGELIFNLGRFAVNRRQVKSYLLRATPCLENVFIVTYKVLRVRLRSVCDVLGGTPMIELVYHLCLN